MKIEPSQLYQLNSVLPHPEEAMLPSDRIPGTFSEALFLVDIFGYRVESAAALGKTFHGSIKLSFLNHIDSDFFHQYLCYCLFTIL